MERDCKDFYSLILKLQQYWHGKGCSVLQPYDSFVGAGTFHPMCVLKSLGEESLNIAYLQPTRRPTDGRYGDSPNRLQHYYQFQVLQKPAPKNIQDIYLDSLEAIGIDVKKHDIRFVEDDWESPSLAAWGLGWEVWCDGMEISQFTYFQQMAGQTLEKGIPVEITYGLERLAMYVLGVDNVYDLPWNAENGTKYGDIFLEIEKDFCKYNFETANTEFLKESFLKTEEEVKYLLQEKQPWVAYDYVTKLSHIFNLLDARGVISVSQRALYIATIAKYVKLSAKVYLETKK